MGGQTKLEWRRRAARKTKRESAGHEANYSFSIEYYGVA